jgi:metal-responsive CopG/Arc/MetJ family transcriptional regulator
MTKDQTEAVTLRMPQELLAEIDRRLRTRFVTRSDAIRSMLWQQIMQEREHRAGGDQEAAA